MGFLLLIDRLVGLESRLLNIQDPNLRERAASLPSLVLGRWAPATNAKYQRGWVRWEEWCRRHPESPARPAIAFYICLYLNDLVLDECKFGALNEAASGIRWGHLQAGFANPMDNEFVGIVLEGAKRKVGKPMTSDIAKKVAELFGQGSNLVHDCAYLSA